MAKPGARKATVTRTLCRAASIAWQMRRNAGSPSTSGRKRLPALTGYEPQVTNGMCGRDATKAAGSASAKGDSAVSASTPIS